MLRCNYLIGCVSTLDTQDASAAGVRMKVFVMTVRGNKQVVEHELGRRRPQSITGNCLS